MSHFFPIQNKTLLRYLNLKRIIELKRRDFFKLPVAKKVLSEKKMSRVVVNFATFQKDCNLFLVHEKEH